MAAHLPMHVSLFGTFGDARGCSTSDLAPIYFCQKSVKTLLDFLAILTVERELRFFFSTAKTNKNTTKYVSGQKKTISMKKLTFQISAPI